VKTEEMIQGEELLYFRSEVVSQEVGQGEAEGEASLLRRGAALTGKVSCYDYIRTSLHKWIFYIFFPSLKFLCFV
jgi:hypothetical protein